MAQVKIAGLDGSKTNFGIAIMTLDTETMELSVDELVLLKTEKEQNKQVRKSSDNLIRSQYIARGLDEAIKNCTIAFFEVPSGGQSHDAVLGFGIVIGLYASIKIPTAEVSPAETKLAAVGTRTASKEEMMEWARAQYPDAPWRLQTRNGKTWKIGDMMADNEHLADAVAIVHAGILTPSFKQTIAILNMKAA